MKPIVRLYATEESAREAVRILEESGFAEDAILLVTPPEKAGAEAKMIQSAVDEGLLPGSHIRTCTAGLKQGRSIVSVDAPFGSAQAAVEILEECGPVDSERLPPPLRHNPAPLSEFLGIPVLSSQRPTEVELPKSNSYSFPSWFGLGLLSRGATPLSSLFGIPTLTSPKKRWEKSFGLPLLSRNPTPLSKLTGLRTLTSSKRSKETSFGFRLLSRNPTPLSSLFGLRVLSKKDRDRDRSKARE